MLNRYNSEIEGMIDFWKEINIDPDYSLSTDGRYKGNLIEFKLVFTNLNEHKKQIKRYIQSYNSAAFSIPKYSYLISINERKYIKLDNSTNLEIESKKWNNPTDFLDEFNLQDEYIKGWIDEFSIVAYNNKLCNENPRTIKTKEDVKNEFINPKFLNIEPFNWHHQLKIEEADLDNIGWLHFNMNMLGPSLLKKQLGAFFTPDCYVKIATEMVRDAIKKVPKGNDYIILDRCAGTGNLERFLREDELSHCVLNTIDYTEWTTLKGLYEGRVKMIIPPTKKGMDSNTGLLTNGDALAKEFMFFCFHNGQMSLFDTGEFDADSKRLSGWLTNPKMTIIMLENPPFVEPQGGASQGKKTFKVNDIFMYKEMGKEKFDTKNVNRDKANLFIWSAFKFFLKPNDFYVLFSPIKYWKSQHIIDKKFIKGYICNRLKFNAAEGGISLIEWQNVNTNNETLPFNTDLGKRNISKNHSNPLKLMKDPEKDNNKAIAWLFNLSNIPKPDNGKLVNIVDEKYRAVQKAYKLDKTNILQLVPLWTANCYDYEDYTEIEVIQKSADKGDLYCQDDEFLTKCFIWGGLTNKNKCISDKSINNEYCFLQHSLSDNILKTRKLDNIDKKLLQQWNEILSISKTKEEFVKNYKYGLHQIEKDINVKIGSGTYNKKGEEIMIKKYLELDEKIQALKKDINVYYTQNLKKKLFFYQLLK